MTICKKTDFNELYVVLCHLITKVTGRKCWRKMGMQAAPRGPYATIYLKEGPSAAQDVIEEFPVLSPATGGFTIVQAPKGLTHLECQAEFFRNVAVMSALDAAIRFRQSLQVDERFFDIWRIAGLTGEIQTVDFSAMFRVDVEGRAEVRFSMYACIGATPLTSDNQIYDINEQGILVFKDVPSPEEDALYKEIYLDNPVE